jgi:glycosyltransferase involved in cell wall biosynthesis
VSKNRNGSLVSVLMPIHGEAPHLEKALESIRNQESVETELVVVLDRPTPSLKRETELLLANLKKKKLLVSPGSGISEALNFGIEHCLGKYVARIDSDDEMTNERLTKQKLFLDNNPEISCVGTQIIKISENNVIIGKSHYPSNPFLLSRILRIRNCVAHPSVMYRRDEVQKIGGYRSVFDGAEDYDLWIRLTREGSIANLNEHLTKYRIWNGQETKKYIGEKNTRAYRVQLFAELEEFAPGLAAEFLSKRLIAEDLMAAAEEYLRENATLRWRRSRRVLWLNVSLSRKNQMFSAKSLSVVLASFLHLSLLSLSIRFTGDR